MLKCNNELGYRVRESSKYRTTYLLDNDTHIIKFVQNIKDLEDYKIIIVELGNDQYKKDPITIILYGDAARNMYNAYMNK